MARERTVTRALVLRCSPTGEADTILTVLTAERGKLPVVAKGARSRRSKVTAAAQLLAYSEMTLSESHGWQYLVEANTLCLFDSIRRDVALLSLASYFAQLTETVAWEESEGEALLRHLLNALYALDTLKKPQALVKAAFEFRLMALAGFAPLLEGCPVCGRGEPEEPVLDLSGGMARCRACGGSAGTVALTGGALAAIRHVVGCEPRRLYSFTLDEGHWEVFARAAEMYTKTVLDRELDTLDFYKRVRG